jgi:UTP--glucose-1-phosphate uridylyltransferase
VPKVRKAVIPAAGRGTRHYPASAAVQKEIFPLVDRDGITKPIIQIIIEEAIDSGIEEICIVTQPGGDAIYREYFRPLDSSTAGSFRGKQWAIDQSETLGQIGRQLHFAQQSSPDGFGHAVFQARDFVGDEPFLLLLGDHVYVSNVKDRCARQLIGVFEQNAVDAATAVQLETETALHLFGVIKGDPVDPAKGVYRALRIIEKPSLDTAREQLLTPGLPTGSYLAHFGMHVFSPHIFGSLEFLIRNNVRENGEFQLTAAQEHLRQQGETYWAVVINGIRFDAGIPMGLIETQLGLALNGVHRAEVLEAISHARGM